MQQLELGEQSPKVANDAFIAPCATVAGNVEVWDYASVWYGTVLRSEKSVVRYVHSLLCSLGRTHAPRGSRCTCAPLLLFYLYFSFLRHSFVW